MITPSSSDLSLLIDQLGEVHLSTEDQSRRAFFELQMKAILREIAARLDRLESPAHSMDITSPDAAAPVAATIDSAGSPE